jgi:pimeloyl-ACP methyl ester carboxylesterase
VTAVTDVRELDLRLPDGRVLHVYDTGPAGGPTVYWHHGTPNIGVPPEPLFEVGQLLGIRWISHDRPGYGASTPQPGRSVADVAPDVAAVTDELGIERFAVFGHSGGGPHALACAALLPGRVTAVAAGSSIAPYGADGLDFFAGMASGSTASLRAATQGRAVKEAYEADPPPDADIGFGPADHEALMGDWAWFGPVVAAGFANGPGPMIDDDLAYVGDWGFDPAAVPARTLFFTGDQDRMVPPSHSRWLAGRVPGAELRVVPGEGHVSVLVEGPAALRWLV